MLGCCLLARIRKLDRTTPVSGICSLGGTAALFEDESYKAIELGNRIQQLGAEAAKAADQDRLCCGMNFEQRCEDKKETA